MTGHIYSITARDHGGKMASYRFYADNREEAQTKAQEICAEVGYELIRVTKLGTMPNILGAWL
jgi:hypothetical protein